MLISELLATLEARSVALTVDGGTLWVKPAGRLSAAERETVRACKPALVAVVQLRDASTARIVEPGWIRCDRELSQLWRVALDACPGEVVTIGGEVRPKVEALRAAA